jgi:hypothetical protein
MPKTFTCDCGFEWLEGTSGSHECGPFYRATIKRLQQELNSQSAIIRSINQNKPDVEVNGNKFFVERGVLGGFTVTHFDMNNFKEEWMADKLIELGWIPPNKKKEA